MLRKLLLIYFFLSYACFAFGQFKFIENKNQWHEKVKYRAELPSGFLFLERSGFSYLFYDPATLPQHPHTNAFTQSKKNNDEKTIVKKHAIKIEMVGASENVVFATEQALAGHYNFLMGNRPEKWGRKAKAYGKIHYQNIYDGINLTFLQEDAFLKYEFSVSAGADPQQIILSYSGQDDIYLHEGDLYLKTSVNAMREEKPYSYQVINGKKMEVISEFRLENNQLSFHFPEGYNTNYELIIDPKLIFSTFSGSTQDNWGFTATPDEEGHLYAGGMTRIGIGTFPTTPGAIQEIGPSYSNNSHTDIGITKYAPDGTTMIYSTYLGGDYTDIPHSLLVNHQNQLIVLGTTSAIDFPVTSTAYDTTFNGGRARFAIGGVAYFRGSDLFVSVLSEAGDSLIGSTYLGGSQNDGLNIASVLTRNYGDEFRGDIAVDDSDNIYICSVTESSDFPLEAPFQGTLQGTKDAIIAKLSANVSDLIWSTYLGGSSDEAAHGLRLDIDENIVLTGGTTSTDFPTSDSVLHETYQGGPADGFISIFSNDGQQILASTYLGTDQYDQSFLIDLDEFGNIGVFGQTLGLYPVSDSVYHVPLGGQFIHKLSPNLRETEFSTVIGSEGNTEVNINIRPTAFLFDECKSMYLTGWGGEINQFYISGSNTLNMPTTDDALQKETDGSDFYMMALSFDAKELQYATYFGNLGSTGDHVDGGTSRFDKKGVVYQSVCSCGDSGFPTSFGVVSQTNSAAPRCNNVAFKLDLAIVNAKITPTQDSAGIFVNVDRGCEPLELVFLNDSIEGQSFEWNFGDGNIIVKNENTITPHTYENAGSYAVSLLVTDSASCKKIDVAVDTITVLPAQFGLSPDSSICEDASRQLLATGGTSYSWFPSTFLSDTTIANPISSPDSSISYQVAMANEFGCLDTQQVSISIIPKPQVSFSSDWGNYACGEIPNLMFTNQSSEGSTFIWELSSGEVFSSETPPIFQPKEIEKLIVKLTAFQNGCSRSEEKEIDIFSIGVPPNAFSPNGDGINDTFEIPNIGDGWRLRVFNRWGDLVFQTDNYQNDWRGDDNAGETFFYHLTSPSGNTCKGTIHVFK